MVRPHHALVPSLGGQEKVARGREAAAMAGLRARVAELEDRLSDAARHAEVASQLRLQVSRPPLPASAQRAAPRLFRRPLSRRSA